MTTLIQALKGFILSKEAEGRSWHTIQDYSVHLERFASHVNGKKVEEMDAHTINKFFAWYRKDFRITHRGAQPIEPRPLSSKSLRNAWASLSSFWSWACEEFRIEESPFRIPCPKAKTKPIEPLTREDVERLLAFANTRNKALILTLLDTGVRVSEICAVDLEDLDLKSGRLYLKQTKGDKPRDTFLGNTTRKTMWSYLSKKRGHESGPLFLCHSNASRLTRNAVRLMVQRLARKAGVKHCSPHMLRHTFAITFLRNGGNVFVLQRLLGHSDLSTTKKYLHLVAEDLENAHKQSSPCDNWRLKI